MKLSIRSSIAHDLQKILETSPTRYNFCFRVGIMTRDGFRDSMSKWQLKNIQQELNSEEIKTQPREFEDIYTIGGVFDNSLLLGRIAKTSPPSSLLVQGYELKGATGAEYRIYILPCSIQVEFMHRPKDLKTLFDPIKLIHRIMKPLLGEPIENPNPMHKRKAPVRLSSQKTPSNHWVIAPSVGEWGTLVVHSSTAYLFLHNSSTTLDAKNLITHSTDNGMMVLDGYWDNDIFTICDPITINGKDVTTCGISHRLALAKRACLTLEFCRVTSIYPMGELSQNSLVSKYGGIIYIPRKDRNKGLNVYKSVQRIGLFFKVTRKYTSGFSFFELTDDEGVFLGTKKYPFHTPISLSREDRDFLDLFPPLSTFEFRWENDNLVPYALSHRRSLSSRSNQNEWNFLHQTQELFKNTVSSPKELMMANQRNPLKKLPVNKSVVFYSPVEGEDVLVRTGTIGEGSCLFHALLHAYSKDYATMDRKGRMKFVFRLRASMAGKVDKESWEEMGKGVISKVPFQENVCEILENFYSFVQKKDKVRGRSSRRVVKKLIKNEKNSDIYELLTELVPLKTLTLTCIPKGYDRTQDQKIDQTSLAVCEEVLDHLRSVKEVKQLSDKKIAYIEKKMSELILTTLKESKESAYRSYIKGLERVTEDVDTYTIDFISERFNRDIYFLDGTRRLPYNTFPTNDNLKGRKSMVVLWVGGNHYEIVGRLLPGNRIQREFPPDDELINRIRTFLTKPEKISEIYPDLTEYLPRSYQSDSPRRRSIKDDDDDDDDDDESVESDHYYDSSDNESDNESD